jgi:cell division protein ZapA (FtsZ GTPase activity inhibitor)
VPLNTFNVDLVGPTFAIHTDESLDYMQSLVARLRDRLGSIKSSTKVSDPLKLTILLSVTLMDELVRERARGGEGKLETVREDELSAVAARLIASLDRSLEGGEPEQRE